ncbi:unnamed protein product, partial [marine sediment metagenome]
MADYVINNNVTIDNNLSFSVTKDDTFLSFTTNDPEFANQWHYNNIGQTGGTQGADIDLKKAWDIQMGSDNVIVAVIDYGIDI